MQENLLDMDDIFTKSIGNSPLNENIESLDKLEQVIAEFDEGLRDNKYTLTSSILKDSDQFQQQSLPQNETQNDLLYINDQNQFLEEQEENLLQIEADKFIDQPQSSNVLKEISQSQIINVNSQKNNESELSKKNESSFSVKDDVLGGIQLSYVDFSKKIYQQYKEQLVKNQENQINQFTNSQSCEQISTRNININNLPKQENRQQEQAEDERQMCLEKGIGKIKELGDTIKNSINIMHQKFNEVKGCVSQLAEQDKHKDMWDNKLNEFYNKLFRQASKALFTSNIANNNTPSKLVIQKPQSVYRFNTKSSVTKPLSSNISNIQNRKPGSVNKFSVLNKPKSVSKFQMTAQEKPSEESKASSSNINTNLPQNQRQKSFTVQKFNTNKINQTQPATNNTNLGVLKSSKDIKKDSLKKPSTTPSSLLSYKKQSLGKENINFFKK
ncbi:hypothetical protein TTHERM_01443830 (macronuclear) [Tetrahymena thermophila SB210]|uniref:Uncharacterized protein n=1 Tax=Tetrahymena thermophila (strain SB210) TaxID=312017 RepID=Q229C0_TETTS|nr:hypothetical protein TTHERM_01443830 [Tetrahymena thermophila SB210]EAR81885.1 hypothetical protein TTHERM_01443830 [Tetrahymena thermophila SB210]|eukprot:XP_001029548.1 hypothetical protein TTHERM_01443830 [Tetrahymena thermophila SB210]